MGFLDLLFGRDKRVEPPQVKRTVDDVHVPLRVFRKFQDDTGRHINDLRSKYQGVVRENLSLKKAIVAFSSRLDKLQEEQRSLRQEVREETQALDRRIHQVSLDSNPQARNSLAAANAAMNVLDQSRRKNGAAVPVKKP